MLGRENTSSSLLVLRLQLVLSSVLPALDQLSHTSKSRFDGTVWLLGALPELLQLPIWLQHTGTEDLQADGT